MRFRALTLALLVSLLDPSGDPALAQSAPRAGGGYVVSEFPLRLTVASGAAEQGSALLFTDLGTGRIVRFDPSHAALLRVRIVDAVGDATVQAVLLASEVAAGLHCGLPVGTYTVIAESSDGKRSESAIAVTGQTRVFRVALR